MYNLFNKTESEKIMELTDASPIDIVGQTARNEYFDRVVGHIEDIVLSEEFVILHNAFLETHWQSFHDTEENRLEYMDIFMEYVGTFETFLVEELHKRIEDFDMQRFANELSKNADKREYNYDEILELLHSFNNFEAFKELMLDYRFNKERKSQNLDFDSILITKPLYIKEENFNSTKMDDDNLLL